MLFCSGCAERRAPERCTKKCVEKYGPLTTCDRFPPLDGFVSLEAPNCPSEEDESAVREAYFDRKRTNYRPIDRLLETGRCVVQLRYQDEDGSVFEFGDPMVVYR